jgi:phosphatidylcholine synthase
MSVRLVLAWLVHLYTALGAAVAFFAIVAIQKNFFQEAFWLMGLAVVIDATDGTLARWVHVKDLIPSFDGDRLEDVIDYANYVIVPSLFLLHANLLPPQDALWLATLPLIASAYGFCQKEAKTTDHYFLGFPSYWNIVVFYLYILQAPQWVNAFTIMILSLLVFVPIRYVYPSRSPRFRGLTNGLGIVWAIALFVTIGLLPQPPLGLIWFSLFFPIYYITLSFWLAVQRLRD